MLVLLLVILVTGLTIGGSVLVGHLLAPLPPVPQISEPEVQEEPQPTLQKAA